MAERSVTKEAKGDGPWTLTASKSIYGSTYVIKGPKGAFTIDTEEQANKLVTVLNEYESSVNGLVEAMSTARNAD